MKSHAISARRIALTFGIFLAGAPALKADWLSEISAGNPLHWFRFDEGAGATVAIDHGSAAVSGSYLDGVSLGAAGVVGEAATFDGTGHVIIGQADLDVDWTVEGIFFADSATGGASMGLLGADFTAATRVAIKAEQWNETGQLGYTSFGVADITFGDTAAATPAGYAYVAFVGQAGGLEVFVNGVSAGTDALSVSLSRHVIGASAVRDTGALIDGLTGGIDELVVYNRALAPAEIASHFAAIPEPGVALLASCGLAAVVVLRRRRR